MALGETACNCFINSEVKGLDNIRSMVLGAIKLPEKPNAVDRSNARQNVETLRNPKWYVGPIMLSSLRFSWQKD